jgi:AAA15 family ATPase/GTPase
MRLTIKNFRSIREQEVELAPITVVYGPNGSGKSSLLYALLTLKNIVLNPNQPPAGFFNYGFASLGGFESVVFDHQTGKSIILELTLERDGRVLSYKVAIGENAGDFVLSLEKNGEIDIKLNLPIPFPYPANQQAQASVASDYGSLGVIWNGITAQVQAGQPSQEAQEGANKLATYLNELIETIRKVSFVPLKRGFSKPQFSTVSISPMIATEDEIASFISNNNKYLVPKISLYLEKILERDLRVNFTPGTAIFSLDATDRNSGIASELVNEGFGVNQIVYILAKCLHHDAGWVCIEEPEIHLHPTAIRNLARALARIVREEEKQFVISTHSESFLLALLALVDEGELKPAELACYLAQKEKRVTRFERQVVNEKGQIEGGLMTFIEGELEDIRTFMKITE